MDLNEKVDIKFISVSTFLTLRNPKMRINLFRNIIITPAGFVIEDLKINTSLKHTDRHIVRKHIYAAIAGKFSQQKLRYNPI